MAEQRKLKADFIKGLKTEQNLIENPNGFQNTLGWEAYDDGAGPYVDGTGGSPTAISIARTQSAIEILSPPASLRLDKAASDASGEGVSVTTITIPRGKRGEPIYGYISFDATDGNYTGGDVAIKSYDITNTEILNVIGADADDVTIPASLGAIAFSIVPNSDTEQVRLSLHIESDSNTGSSWEIPFSDIELGYNKQIFTTAVGPWQSFTPTGTWTTNTTYEGVYRRVGDTMECKIKASLSGTPNAANFAVDVPFGLTIDSNKVLDVDARAPYGQMIYYDNSSGLRYYGTMVYNTSTRLQARWLDVDVGGTNLAPIGPFNSTDKFTKNTNDEVNVEFAVPIEEWSTGNVLSTSELSLQTINARASLNSAQSISNASQTPLDLDTIEFDPFGIVDLTGDELEIKKAGVYLINGNIQWESGTASNNTQHLITKNGSVIAEQINNLGANIDSYNVFTLAKLAVGDTIALEVTQNSGGNRSLRIGGSGSRCFLELTALPDFSIIGTFPDRSVSQVRYQLGNGHGSTNTVIRRWTNEIETLGTAITYINSAVNGDSFTINEPGIYSISYVDRETGGGAAFGISRNSSQLTTSIVSINAADRLASTLAQSGAEDQTVSWTGYLAAGDVIRAHTDGNTDDLTTNQITIVKIRDALA